ncbi:hypothetical protein BJX68DRAFT_265400 [Aspergillus pseudodeflectus]|uniref:Mannosidase Ig/CBM-like domain-containing protein n=1 Tax=Aspergillus pseudodeflectus TaxID=176178 RepID=A0ABR4KLL7_9EURO
MKEESPSVAYWAIWHGTQEKYQRYGQIGGQFNREFGLASFPVLETADGHERRTATYIAEKLRIVPGLGSWVYLTQLSQSEAMLYAYRGWRRQWGEERRKPAFYTVKRAPQPLVAGVQREHHDWSVCHARPAKVSKYSVCVTSSLRRGSTLDVGLRFVSIDSGEDIKPAITKAGLTMPDNGSVTAITGQIDNRTNETHVLAVSFSRDGTVISRDVDPPQPFKYFPSRIGVYRSRRMRDLTRSPLRDR